MKRLGSFRSPGSTALLVVLLAFAQATLAAYRGVSTGLPLLAWAALCILLALLWVLPGVLRREGARAGVLLLALGFAWVFVVQMNSVAPELSIGPTWAWIVAVATAVVVGVRHHADRDAPILLLAVLLPPAVGAVQVGWILGIEGIPLSLARVRDPNVAADALSLALLVLVAGISGARRDSHGWFALAVAIAAAGALCIQLLLSARISMALLVLAMVLVTWSTRSRRWRLLPVAVAGVYLLPYVLPEWMLPRAPLPQFTAVAGQSQLGPRAGVLEAALELMPQHFVTGSGLMAFSILFPPLRAEYLDDNMGIGSYMVHNDWLQLTLEGGLPWLLGLLAFAGLCFLAWLRLARRLANQVPQRPADLVALAALVGVGLVLGHALVNFPLYDPAVLSGCLACGAFGISVAFGTGEPPVRAPIAPEARQDARIPKTIGVVTATLIVGLAIAWCRLAIVSVGAVAMGASPPVVGAETLQLPASRQFEVLTRVGKWIPEYSIASYAQAQASTQLLLEGQTGRPDLLRSFARDAYERAIEKSPWITEYYVQYARFLRETSGAPLDARLALLRRGLEYDPQEPRLWLAMMVALEQAGRGAEASRLATEGWLGTCGYAARRDPTSAAAILERIRPADRTLEQARLETCEALLARELER
jgi:O-antigen ligase